MLRSLVHGIGTCAHSSRAAVRRLHSSGCNLLHDARGNDPSTTSAAQEEMHSGLPDVMPETDEGGGPPVSEEEMKRRKNKAVMSWLEEQMGQDRMDAARLLQQHNVIVRGGPQEGKKLLDALVGWKQKGR
ncbi:hypothetical protein CVIRNUC_009261 [Coccomyxa viridis]|uniref:Uncharacterized protein n=1 Tax=Coccomyxa viridis TaxID=1274662 RepID=A0AAV1IFE5_9CHLO|nr:hypothetical protein CVIRNUC_009261 [Coccomyxa viridis]